MNRCLQCSHVFCREGGWQCPACGFEPTIHNGIQRFLNEAQPAVSYPVSNLDELAGVQRDSFWFRGRNALIAALVALDFKNLERVLEVGCGSGSATMALRDGLPSSVRLVGAEPYLAGLNRCRDLLGKDVELVQCDAHRLPYTEEFDLICSFDVLEHIEDDRSVLSEMVRALKPGGGLILTVPQHMSLWSEFDIAVGHKRRYDPGELEAKCEGAGLSVTRSSSFVSVLLPVAALARRFYRESYRFSPHRRSPIVSAVLERILKLEVKAISAGWNFPFGLSRVIVARKSAG